MRINGSRYFLLLTLLIVLFPQLPVLMNKSEVHINLLIIGSALFSLFMFNKKIVLRQYAPIFLYYLTLQTLLIFSYVCGDEDIGGMSDVMSLTRPTFLLIITVSITALFSDIKDFYTTLIKTSKLVLWLVLPITLLELLHPFFTDSLIYFLYKIPNKPVIDGISVSYFTLPYYSSYVLSITTLPFLSLYAQKPSVKHFMYIILNLFCVFSTGSKAGIFCAIFVIMFYSVITIKSKKIKFWFYTVFGSIFASVAIFSVFILSYFKEMFGGGFFTNMYVIVTNPEQSGTLGYRLDKIYDTFSRIYNNNPFVGLGLGKGETIESWIGVISYRYGFFGFLFFIIFFSSLSLYHYRLAKNLKITNHEKIELSKWVAVWSASIFISQLSSLGMEFSKLTLFTASMFATTVILKIRTHT